MTSMKVAVVHDWLDTYRGGERVLEAILELYPDAVIFTLFYNPAVLPTSITNRKVILPKRLPRFMRYFRKILLPFLPTIIESFDFSEYDLVISSSSCVAKGVVTGPSSVHVSYVHSPMRYIWDERFRYFESLPSLVRTIGYWPFHAMTKSLRQWDVTSSFRVDAFIANSRFVASRIRMYFGRESAIIYPGVKVDFFSDKIVPFENRDSYYLVLGAHVFYKRHDFAVSLFSKHPEFKLVVAGSGPELEKLKSLAGPNIRFVINPSADEAKELYQNSKGLFFPGVEDFGMVPVEAMAAGCPVFAFGKGGALDSVVQDVSGSFFTIHDESETWNQFLRFTKRKWDSREISAHAQKFSVENFKKHFLEAVSETLLKREQLTLMTGTNGSPKK